MMTQVLPIVDRELRVASRRWGTFLARVSVAALALLLTMPSLLFGWMTGGSNNAGRSAFVALTMYSFVVCVLAGVWLTADSLSGEKREGTLGLLFLTDLRGHDVVLGKFAALALNAMFALVAVLPVLALPLLLGGVTGSQFWRVALALLNTLFLSLCAGTAVSAVGRDAARTFSGTFLLLLFLVVALPMGASLMAQFGSAQAAQWFELFSPWTAFRTAQTWSSAVAPSDFWLSLVIPNAVAWAMLAFASLVLPRAWQDHEVVDGRTSVWQQLVGRRIARLFRARRPARWLERSPILWLMGERPVLRAVLWVLAGGWTVFILFSLTLNESSDVAVGYLMGGLAYLWVFMLVLVEHSCRFWVEARQDGTLEALLSVPIESRRIISSHWASIRHHFMWPMLTVMGVSTLPTWWRVVGEAMGGGANSGALLQVIVGGGVMGGMALAFTLANFFAIGWTGMWLALKLKRPQFASGLTLVCILSPYVVCWLGIGGTIVFIILPMSLVTSNLRGMILQHYTPVFRQGGRN